jgi:uncharacterized membrane protein YhaH (DUF805 family)
VELEDFTADSAKTDWGVHCFREEVLMEYMFMPLRRYVDFSGRSRRKEYWMFFLFVLIVTAVLTVLTGTRETNYTSDGMGFSIQSQSPFVLIWVLVILLPSLAVQVRRFHDQDKSGWFVLLGFIPFVGGIIVLVFMCLEGTRGDNRFGADPKGGANADTFS